MIHKCLFKQDGNTFCTTLQPRLFTIDLNVLEHQVFFTEVSHVVMKDFTMYLEIHYLFISGLNKIVGLFYCCILGCTVVWFCEFSSPLIRINKPENITLNPSVDWLNLSWPLWWSRNFCWWIQHLLDWIFTFNLWPFDWHSCWASVRQKMLFCWSSRVTSRSLT